MAITDEKQELRRIAKEQRASLTGRSGGRSGRDAAETLARNFFKVIKTAGQASSLTVAGYWPMADEIDVRPLMTRLFDEGGTVALPVVVAPEEPLIFRRWRPGMELEAGGFSTRHPGPEAPEVVPDVLLVPLLAFDDRGFRLGWGGGFYDRTLARLRSRGPVVAVGVAYHGQKVDVVPVTSDDEQLDLVVTDEEILEIDRQ